MIPYIDGKLAVCPVCEEILLKPNEEKTKLECPECDYFVEVYK